MSLSVAFQTLSGAAAGFGRRAGGGAALALLGLALAACAGSESRETLQGAQPCLPSASLDARAASCGDGRNVLLAVVQGRRVAAGDVVESEVLEEQRGGFITAGGLKIDFGFEFQTIVNGTPQLTSTLSYNDILASGGAVPTLNTVRLGGGDAGATDIVHVAGPNGIGATIVNSQDGLRIENISTLAIDIIDLRSVHKGGPNIGAGRPLPLEFHESVVRSLN